MPGKFIAVVCRKKACPKCDDPDQNPDYVPGIWERMDCGCVWEEEIGRYDKQNTARLVCISVSTAVRPAADGSLPTGNWGIETEEDGVVEWN